MAALALRQVLRFEPRSVKVLAEIVAAKRPELIVRSTRYAGLVVDERVLTGSFPWTAHAATAQAVMLLEGSLLLVPRGAGPALRVSPGEVALLVPTDAAHIRYEDAHCLDLEWVPPVHPRGSVAVLGRADRARGQELAERLIAGDADDRTLLAGALDLLRAAGAPLGDLSAEALRGSPTEQDLRIAEAIAAQMANLRSAASAEHLGELAGLSPRQLQRVLADFCKRYRMNATSWRDMRNRYRMQLAIFLLSVPAMSVATIADEVGYASAAALARALAKAGLAPATELRAEIARLGGAR